MDPVESVLKQEINQTMEDEHDLAKWKLIVTAALGAAAFGLSKGPPTYWLLFFVPFVCAYVDLYHYQYELRILVIARFLRDYHKGDRALQAYEEKCEEMRERGVFSLGKSAAIGCSIGASVLGPVLYLLQRGWKGADLLKPSHIVAGVIWLGGMALIIILWSRFQDQRKGLSGTSDRGSSARPQGTESPESGATGL
jgi:hypothetical protein